MKNIAKAFISAKFKESENNRNSGNSNFRRKLKDSQGGARKSGGDRPSRAGAVESETRSQKASHESESQVADPTTIRAETKLQAVIRKDKHVAPIIRTARILADYLTEEDIADDARVIREACNATILAYDPHLKRHVERPDHRLRLAASTLRRAYHEGTPKARMDLVVDDKRTAQEVVTQIRDSPEMRAALAALAGLGMRGISGPDGEVIDVEAIIHKSGGEIPLVAQREALTETTEE